MGLAHPVMYASMVARAFAQLAAEAATEGEIPKRFTAVLCAAAEDAAARLREFLATPGRLVTPDLQTTASLAHADLMAMAEITSLVVTHDLRLRDAAYIAQSAGYTANQAIKHLSRLEELLGI